MSRLDRHERSSYVDRLCVQHGSLLLLPAVARQREDALDELGQRDAAFHGSANQGARG